MLGWCELKEIAPADMIVLGRDDQRDELKACLPEAQVLTLQGLDVDNYESLSRSAAHSIDRYLANLANEVPDLVVVTYNGHVLNERTVTEGRIKGIL